MVFLENQDVIELPIQPISLDCDFWQGMDLYMEPPQEMSRVCPDTSDDNVHLYALNQQ